MRHRYNNGGKNKTHEQVEATSRIDSFEVAEIQGHGYALCGRMSIVDVEHFCWEDCCYIYERHGNASIRIDMERKANGLGGEQKFFLCPKCGRRVRYLYFPQKWPLFMCRSCSKLNYKSQQRTKDAKRDYERGCEYAEKHLQTCSSRRPDMLCFDTYIPPRPKGMHYSTYIRHLAKFAEYRNQYEEKMWDDWLADYWKYVEKKRCGDYDKRAAGDTYSTRT